jgi:gluconolactonase
VKPSLISAFGVALGLHSAACANEPARPAASTPPALAASATADSGTGASAGCPAGPFAAPLPQNPVVSQIPGVPPPGYATGATSNVEGALWLGGALYVSHIQEGVANPPPSRILRIMGSAVEVYLPEAGTNGLALGNDGAIVGARHADGTLSRLDPTTKTFTPLVKSYQNARFDSPNDLAIRSDGNVYFSDPDYQAATPRPQARTRVYRVDPRGNVSVIDDQRIQPNGVTLSADERTLYVADTRGVHRYAVAADGAASAPSAFSTTPSDGMAMDCAGNLYLTAGRAIVVLAASGAIVGSIENAVPEGASTTNAAFGGPDRKRLFITARGSAAGLWFVDLSVPGKAY